VSAARLVAQMLRGGLLLPAAVVTVALGVVGYDREVVGGKGLRRYAKRR